MKPVFFCLLLLSLFVSLTAVSHAQCPNGATITSFNLSPGTIAGDESDLATGTIQGCIEPGGNQFAVYFDEHNISGGATYCYGGYLSSQTCNFPGSPGNVTVSFAISAYNSGTTNMNATIGVYEQGQAARGCSTSWLT